MATKEKVVQQLSEEAADELVKGVRQLKSSGKLKKLAKEVGVSTEALEKVASKGTDALEGLSKKLDDLQLGLDSILKRPSKKPPAVSPEFAKEEIAREKGYRLATPPPPQGMGGPTGGPLVRYEAPTQGYSKKELLENIKKTQGLTPSIDLRPVPVGPRRDVPRGLSEAELADVPGMAAKATPSPGSSGVTEPFPTKAQVRAEETKKDTVGARRGELETTAPGTAAEAEYAATADLGFPMDLSLAKEAKTAGKVLAGAAGAAGVAGAAWKGVPWMLEQKPFSANPEAQKVAPTVATTGADTPKKVTDAVDNAVQAGGVTPEEGEQVKAQVKTLEDIFEAAQERLGAKLDQDRARIEFYQLLDKVVDGFASMLGAKALMNKNLPYSVDFSKGPQIDWNAKLASATKEYETGVAALMSKYKVEKTQQTEQAKMEARAKEKEEDRALRERLQQERLASQEGAKQAQATEKAAAATEKTDAKLAASIQAVLDETAGPGRILTEKKNLVNLGIQKLGQPAIDTLVKQASEEVEGGRNIFRQAEVGAKSLIGMDTKFSSKEQQAVTKRFAELLGEKLAQPAGQAAPASDVEAKRKRLEELQRKAAGGQ